MDIHLTLKLTECPALSYPLSVTFDVENDVERCKLVPRKLQKKLK